MEPESELSLSDADFKKAYLETNRRWFKDYADFHTNRVCCINCKTELSPETRRPYGGKNYCPKDFKKRVLSELYHYFSLDHPLEPNRFLDFEWGMKVARVMDGGLVRMAETSDFDLDYLENPNSVRVPRPFPPLPDPKKILPLELIRWPIR